MPLAGMVLAGFQRKNGLSLKLPRIAMLVLVVIGLACYGCVATVKTPNQGTPSGVYHMTATATGTRTGTAIGTVQHSVSLTLIVGP